ncbi:SLBB domain-containing protein [Curvibacter sp. HBC61]|uniref:SLBB domain-containing protein n=1 Tax=Curvibacter cyanobacteriorum TaxID=3026422 RepID=A0ABT5MTK9_9BURK|nr:SLBB domain-containing protein [Curvibacter sp. HBC61]MDD0837163.1 SLBB domain-containing protein [Curvibacter sp. HBC61]
MSPPAVRPRPAATVANPPAAPASPVASVPSAPASPTPRAGVAQPVKPLAASAATPTPTLAPLAGPATGATTAPMVAPVATPVAPPAVAAPAAAPVLAPEALARSAPAQAAAPLAAGTAAIGAGDVLQVTVFGQPDMSAEVSVTESGEVTLPLIGLIRLAGLSSSDVEKLVARRLREREFLLNPEVSVTVRQNRSQMVSVLGEVVRPGRYPIQGRFTVLDLLATAGGLTPKADAVVFLLRKSDERASGGGTGAGAEAQRVRIPIRLDRVNQPDRSSLDLVLSNDDMVYVGQQKFFYILGEVRRPGSYPMEPDLNVMRALSISGGVTERGSMNRINIHRQADAPNGRELAPRLTDAVMEGDVIYVKERIF